MHNPNHARRQFLAGLLGSTSLALIHPHLVYSALASPSNIDFSALAKDFDGVVVDPAHSAYESARRTASFNPKFNYRPQAIAGCRSESDIARSILFARKHELPVSVRSGGHDVLASSVCEQGLVIDTRFLTQTQFDEKTGQIKVGAGTIAGALNQAAGEYGRAVPLGCNSAVGVSGLTLGGGMGWFVGTLGATCDHVTSARVVTVDGEVLIASEESNADLFWAIRGGGGNFGIVSEWTYNTHPQGDVICGGIVYPARLAREFLSFYREFVKSSPRELTVEVIGNAYHQPMIAAVICYSGDLDKADAVLKPLREFGEVLADGLVRRPYAELESIAENIQPFLAWQPRLIEGQPEEFGSYWQGTTVPVLTDAIIDSIVESIAEAPTGWSFGLGHVQRGACVEVAAGSTPMLRQPGATTVHFDGGWAHASQSKGVMRWIDQATKQVATLGSGAPDYINYLSTNDPAAVRKSYGGNFDRLLRIKKKFDPTNCFNRNRNIRV